MGGHACRQAGNGTSGPPSAVALLASMPLHFDEVHRAFSEGCFIFPSPGRRRRRAPPPSTKTPREKKEGGRAGEGKGRKKKTGEPYL